MSLQRLSVADADMVLTMEADSEVMLHSTGLIAPTEERRTELLAYLASDQGVLGHWAISQSGVAVGWVSLTPLANTQRTQVAYRLMRDYWGKGLATEAVRDICQYAKHVVGLQEIAAVVWPENGRSHRLLERTGFRLEGEAVHYERRVFVYAAQL